MELIRFRAYFDGVACVVAPAVADVEPGAFSKDVDEFSLGLVAPKRADDNERRHGGTSEYTGFGSPNLARPNRSLPVGSGRINELLSSSGIAFEFS